jgi:DNA polymerase III epsilon subunit-like protein
LLGKNTDYSYVNRIVDTLCVAKAQHSDIKFKAGQSLINWQYRLTNFRKRGMKVSLKAMCKANEIEFDESKLHDALYDIKLNKQVFEKLVWQVEI